MTEADIKAAIERGQLAAVRMLDQWCGKPDSNRRVEQCEIDGRYLVELYNRDWRHAIHEFWGDSFEAARANAAEAIRHEL